jgi:Secretion system C-terminal sorting domain
MNQRNQLLSLYFLFCFSFFSYTQVTLEATYPTTDLHRVNWAFGGEKYWYSNDSLKEIKVFTAQHQLLKTIRYPSVLNTQIRLLQNEQAVTQTTVNGDNLLEIIWFFKDTLTKKEQMKIINEQDSVLFIFDGVSDNVQLSEIEGLPSKLFVSINDLGLDTYITKVYALPSLNLENIYFNAYRLHRKKFGYAGEKYFYKDTINEKIQIYNANHSFWKSIKPIFLTGLTFDNNDEFTDADDNVVNSDSLVEVMFNYMSRGSRDWAITWQNGNAIFKSKRIGFRIDHQEGLKDRLLGGDEDSNGDFYYKFYDFSNPVTPFLASTYSISRMRSKKYNEVIYTYLGSNQMILYYNNKQNQKSIYLPIIGTDYVFPYFSFPIINDSLINKDSLLETIYLTTNNKRTVFTTRIANDTGFVYKTIENTKFFSISQVKGLPDKLFTNTGNDNPFDTKIWRFGNTTSIKEGPSVLDVKIYPNPFSNDLTIDVKGNKIFPIYMRLMNVLGEVMYETKTNEERVYLSMPHLSKGLYFLEVLSGNQRSVSKVVKVGF